MDNHNSQCHARNSERNRKRPYKETVSKQQRVIKVQADLLFFEGYLSAILHDTHNILHRLYSYTDYLRDLDTISKRIQAEGSHFATHVLPCLITDCLNLLEGREALFPGFAIQKERNYPRFCRRLFSVVLSGNYDAKTEAEALHGIYNISVAFKKLNGPYSEELLKQQFQEFVDVDQYLEEIDFFDDELLPILEGARSRWSIFAHDITLDHPACLPRPGPGSCVDNTAKSMRYAPHVLFDQIDKSFPYEEWFYPPHPSDLVDQSRNFLNLKRLSQSEPYSEFLYVPKTAGKPRGICKEWNEAQFVQQAIRALLAHYIRLRLSRHLPLEDQTVHADLALQSSIDREKATIDESEASDRIARQLVSWVSQDNAEVHNALMACSTKWIKPPKEYGRKKAFRLRTHKFAPMGSGICFPVMSLVHLFLIQSIIMIKMDHITVAERQDFVDEVSVYGDDIVLPSACAPYVYKWLPRFGMKINQSKSYVHSYFRESCGTHAYKGHDITPVYCRYTTSYLPLTLRQEGNVARANLMRAARKKPRGPVVHNMDEKNLVSLLSTESLLVAKRYFKSAEFLRRSISAKWHKTNLPYVVDGSPVIGFKRPITSRELTKFPSSTFKRKWDASLQSWLYRVPIFKVDSQSESIKTTSEAYLRSLTRGVAAPKSYGDVQCLAVENSPLACPFGPMVPEPVQEQRWMVADSTLRFYASNAYLPESQLMGTCGNAFPGC